MKSFNAPCSVNGDLSHNEISQIEIKSLGNQGGCKFRNRLHCDHQVVRVWLGLLQRKVAFICADIDYYFCNNFGIWGKGSLNLLVRYVNFVLFLFQSRGWLAADYWGAGGSLASTKSVEREFTRGYSNYTVWTCHSHAWPAKFSGFSWVPLSPHHNIYPLLVSY